MYRVFFKIMVGENEILIFHEDFLNKDMSLHDARRSIKLIFMIYRWREVCLRIVIYVLVLI